MIIDLFYSNGPSAYCAPVIGYGVRRNTHVYFTVCDDREINLIIVNCTVVTLQGQFKITNWILTNLVTRICF